MAIGSCSILRSTATSSPLNRFLFDRRLFLRAHCFLPMTLKMCVNSRVSFPRAYSITSILDSVLRDLNHLRASKTPARASPRLGVPSNKEVDEKTEKWTLEKGLLLEFRKDSGSLLLAVVQKPDGKKNWMVCDQNGVVSSIRPQQITFVVPGIEDFDQTQISGFLQRAQSLLDPSILEYAWAELVEEGHCVSLKELSEILYGSAQPLESYCTHCLLSRDDVYFSARGSKGSYSLYLARTSSQVKELLHCKLAKEESNKEFQEFIQLLSSAKASHPHSKPSKFSWTSDEKTKYRIEALENYATNVFCCDEYEKMAGRILRAMGQPKTSYEAVNLLINIGYFPVHVNTDILKSNISLECSNKVLSAVEDLLTSDPDPDEMRRKDLTYLKVYAIDVDEADELDDALSAMKLEDGRIKVWIHVADPSRLVAPTSIIDREAMRRGTSVFLPTATYPMFPEKLAMERMSLQQGKLCKVVSVSVVLNSDGSIAEYNVDNAIIRPTYMLTYESATELLYMNLDEEPEIRILSEAASLRLRWRLQKGAVDMPMISTRVKVPNPDDPEPIINVYIENQADPGMRLVTEMMLLCGEAIATYGHWNLIPLPYRGHQQSGLSMPSFSHLPEGPVRSSAYIKVLRAAEMDFRTPISHGILGLPAYVQFTSPIRRYVDLLAHYQIKAFLRGDPLPFTACQLEDITSLVNMKNRNVKRLSSTSLRYWLLEYLRRQPKGKTFQALILRFIKNRIADLLLLQVGIQSSAEVSLGNQIGDLVDVVVAESHPRRDVLIIRQV